MNFGQFSGKSAEERAFEQLLEAKQMKDFLKMYAGLVDRCFTDCCNDFTSQKLTSKEVGRREQEQFPCRTRRLTPLFRALSGNLRDQMHGKVLETL
jgi:import inner membrane translocase subunit TIM9